MGSTNCIKCGSSIDPFSYCELCAEPLNFKCSSCGFVTETKVHVDCVNANSLVTEESKSMDKNDSKNIAAKPQGPMKSDTTSSNKSSPMHENYPSYADSDIIKKTWNSFTRLNADAFMLSSRLSSLYYEQFLQYEKVWSNYWTETYKLFAAFSRDNASPKTDAI